MRFVPTKTLEQQSCLTLHRTRHLFVRQQTAIINSIHACLAEFGIVAPVGRRGVEQLLEVVANVEDTRLPEVARACVRLFVGFSDDRRLIFLGFRVAVLLLLLAIVVWVSRGRRLAYDDNAPVGQLGRNTLRGVRGHVGSCRSQRSSVV